MQVWKKITQYGKEYGLLYTAQKVWNRFTMKYFLGRKRYSCRVSNEDREKQQRLSGNKNAPLVSILVPVYNTPINYFRKMLDSVRNQTYDKWELCLADASDNDTIEKIVTGYSGDDSQIRYQRLHENKGISENSNAAWKMAQGDYIALLDHDDILHPSALYYAVKELIEDKADFVYTDELSFVGKPSVVQSVHLKMDFYWESLRYTNYICHFTVFRKELMEKAGGFRKEFDGAQDYDLFLRMAELADNIVHIPRVLYYWRLHTDSSAAGFHTKPYVVEAGKKALEEHLDRRGILGEVVGHPDLGTYYHIDYQVDKELRILALAQDVATEDMLKKTLEHCPYSVCIQSGHLGQDASETYNDVILVKSGYVPEKTGYEWLEEILQCLHTGENELAGVATYDSRGRYIQAGYSSDVKQEEPQPLYQGVPIKDSGYMNRLLFRQNVGLLGGPVLGMPWELFNMWKRQGVGDIFEQEKWFQLCRLVREQEKECVLSPRIRWKKS